MAPRMTASAGPQPDDAKSREVASGSLTFSLATGIPLTVSSALLSCIQTTDIANVGNQKLGQQQQSSISDHDRIGQELPSGRVDARIVPQLQHFQGGIHLQHAMGVSMCYSPGNRNQKLLTVTLRLRHKLLLSNINTQTNVMCFWGDVYAL